MQQQLNEYEWQVLEMLNGDRPAGWGACVSACLETLEEAGYCTEGPRYTITDKGKKALEERQDER